MGLSRHVLDTMHGVPAADMALAFYTTQPDADGTAGQVTLNFGVTDTSQHYHMPLLVSPWRYSTYQVS